MQISYAVVSSALSHPTTWVGVVSSLKMLIIFGQMMCLFCEFYSLNLVNMLRQYKNAYYFGDTAIYIDIDLTT